MENIWIDTDDEEEDAKNMNENKKEENTKNGMGENNMNQASMHDATVDDGAIHETTFQGNSYNLDDDVNNNSNQNGNDNNIGQGKTTGLDDIGAEDNVYGRKVFVTYYELGCHKRALLLFKT